MKAKAKARPSASDLRMLFNTNPELAAQNTALRAAIDTAFAEYQRRTERREYQVAAFAALQAQFPDLADSVRQRMVAEYILYSPSDRIGWLRSDIAALQAILQVCQERA